MKQTLKQSTMIKILAVISIAMLLITFGAVSITMIANSNLDQARDMRFDLTLEANNFSNASAYLTQEARKYAVTADGLHYDNYWKEVDTDKRRDLALERMYTIGLTDNEKNLMTEIGNTSNSLIPLEDAAMNSVKESGDTQTATAILYGNEYESGLDKIAEIKSTFFKSIDS